METQIFQNKPPAMSCPCPFQQAQALSIPVPGHQVILMQICTAQDENLGEKPRRGEAGGSRFQTQHHRGEQHPLKQGGLGPDRAPWMPTPRKGVRSLAKLAHCLMWTSRGAGTSPAELTPGVCPHQTSAGSCGTCQTPAPLCHPLRPPHLSTAMAVRVKTET